jgi:hypothetical protein
MISLLHLRWENGPLQDQLVCGVKVGNSALASNFLKAKQFFPTHCCEDCENTYALSKLEKANL